MAFDFGTQNPTLPTGTPSATGTPKPGFAFGASGAPAATGGAPGGFDLNALLQAFMQHFTNQDQQDSQRLGMQQDQFGQRLGLQKQALFGRHLGTGGGEVTPDDPTGSGAFGAGGLFHGGFKSSMSPESLAMSGGNNAVNQWNMPQMFGGNAYKGPTPDAVRGTVLSPGVGQFGLGGERQFMGPGGMSTEYDPRRDRAMGRTGIERTYDPALGGGKPNTKRRGIPQMF